MMYEFLRMNDTSRDRSHVLRLLSKGVITIEAASLQLSISVRQCHRILARYRLDGDASIPHGLCNRPSNNSYSKEDKDRIMELYVTRCHDYGPTLFSEKVTEVFGWILPPQTLRRWLIAERLWKPSGKGKTHRKKRPRRAAIGELVQFDGSPHDWFEGRGAPCTLLVFIDDASGRCFFLFVPSENVRDGLIALRMYLERYGIPHQIYLDRGCIFYNRSKHTDAARALRVLGTEIIYANSPQAKGRVERANRTQQDRLVKALRDRNISSIEDANRFLEESYTDAHNARFARLDGLEDIHRPVGTLDLNNIVCFESTRFVNHDMTFQFNAACYQILPAPDRDLPLPRQHVLVRHWLDGSLHVFWREKELRIAPCQVRPPKTLPGGHPPDENHPWKHKVPIGKAKHATSTKRKQYRA